MSCAVLFPCRSPQRRLSSSGYREELSHSHLVGLHVELERLESERVRLDEELEQYRELPPDLTLARLKVAETRQQLAELEEQFSAQVGELNAHLHD